MRQTFHPHLYTLGCDTVTLTAETGEFMRWQRAVELLYELADAVCGQVLFRVFTAFALLLYPSSSWQTLQSLSRTVDVSVF